MCASQCVVGPCINRLLCCMAMTDHVCKSMCGRAMYKQTALLCGYDGSLCVSQCAVGPCVNCMAMMDHVCKSMCGRA